MVKSHSRGGEASSTADASGKESSVACPTCGRTDFKSELGVKLHHKRSHGESISGVELECSHCGEVYREKECRVDRSSFCTRECKDEWQEEGLKRENNPNYKPRKESTCDYCGKSFERYASYHGPMKFCSRECHGEAMSEVTGGDHPRWVGRETKDCQYCGSEFEVRPNHEHPAKFCSRQCWGEWSSEHGVRSGENNPLWKEKVKLECEWCGGSFEVMPYDKDKRRFCGRECSDKWRSETIRGERHPRWVDGVTPKYGPNWDEQSEKARERDGYQCQKCGKPQEEHRCALPVHHLKRINWFRENYDAPEWYEKGNRLSNLVTLCDSCHAPWEGIPVKPQLAD